jgi:hypothetical protein
VVLRESADSGQHLKGNFSNTMNFVNYIKSFKRTQKSDCNPFNAAFGIVVDHNNSPFTANSMAIIPQQCYFGIAVYAEHHALNDHSRP